ncbi:hypothetical protein LAD77_00680 [Klebsiella pneumoniae]|nr:hypothetical protein [Klebsiella pneumoniae]
MARLLILTDWVFATAWLLVLGSVLAADSGCLFVPPEQMVSRIIDFIALRPFLSSRITFIYGSAGLLNGRPDWAVCLTAAVASYID